MFLKSLPTNISINILAFLFAGMALTGFLIIILIYDNQIKTETLKGKLLIEAINSGNLNDYRSYSDNSKYFLSKAFKTSGYSYLKIKLNTHNLTEEFGNLPKGYIQNKKTKDNFQISFTGSTIGFFSMKKKFLSIRSSHSKNKKIVSEILLVQNLQKIYCEIQKKIKFIFYFIIINTIVLGFLCAYLINKLTVSPLNRLLHRAETIDDTTSLIFHEKEGNEFARLSRALNKIFQRIDSDRKTLNENIKSLKQSNKDLVIAQQNIIHAEKFASIGRLSSGIAHEIGNPLGIIGGYIELLKNDESMNRENKDYLERSEKELTRIDKIIKQLLEYSRGNIDTDSESKKNFGINTLLNEIYLMFSGHPILSGIDLSLEINASEDSVYADYDHLKQVFINLVINAVDAIKSRTDIDDGRLSISNDLIFLSNEKHDNYMENNNRIIEIIYKDNGIGISENDLPNIFDPFYTTKEPGKGTGLGLSVCQTIIEDLNGKIEVFSNSGSGTEVKIKIPLVVNIDG